MTKDKFSPTRRSVLRLGAMSALGVGVGIPAVSGSVAATGCPRTPGYWANHPDMWYTVGLWYPYNLYGYKLEPDNLLDPSKGLKNKIMAKHLMATMLNFMNRKPITSNDGKGDKCVDRPIKSGPFEGKTVRYVKLLAQVWLYNASTNQKKWYVTIDKIPTGQEFDDFAHVETFEKYLGKKLDGESIKDTLDYFNNNPGKLGLKYCPCRGED